MNSKRAGDLVEEIITNLIKFIDVLRLAGVRASVAESIDAVLALKYVDILDRNEVRTALSSCLAKSEEERKIFAQAFDSFFMNPELRDKKVCERKCEIQEEIERIEEEASELIFQGEQIDIPNDLKEVYANISAEEKKSIREFLDRTSAGKNVKQDFKSTVEKMVKGRLSRLKEEEGINTGLYDAVTSEAGIIAGEITERVRDENSLMYKNIGEIGDEDVPAAIRLIRTAVERLKRNASRRLKKSSRKARLDIKKTIRSNLSTGGVQFRLKYKKRSKRKDRLLILCDVSASMQRFAGFVLQFIIGMDSSFSSTDSYIFSDELEHLNIDDFVSALDFEERIKKSPVWKKGTNIGNALFQLLQRKDLRLNSSTTVLIVSDAKTLDTIQTENYLKELKKKAKNILWLNPVPEKDWDRIKGIDGFRNYCIMLDCSTIERLAKACGGIYI
ncbi:MAG: vWA domain-containing protein [Acetivibrionales bacterium]